MARSGGFAGAQDASEVRFGHAVAVLHRGIEIVDAGIQREADGPVLIGGRPAHHQAADGAAAEAENRKSQAGTAENACFHGLVLLDVLFQPR